MPRNNKVQDHEVPPPVIFAYILVGLRNFFHGKRTETSSNVRRSAEIAPGPFFFVNLFHMLGRAKENVVNPLVFVTRKH